MLDILVSALLQSASVSACTPPEGYGSVSEHMAAIQEGDQGDRRQGGWDHERQARDEQRKADVAAYVEGDCLQTGDDFVTAALVMQHSRTSEAYMTAWRLAVRAHELGHERGLWLIPRAIDRYLISEGYKQLYATNLKGSREGPDAPIVMCLWPVVDEITDEQRIAMGVRTVEQQLQLAAERGNGEGHFCDVDAADPPRGLFPGYW